MKFFKGIFSQARSILRLALPVALAQLGNVAVQVADSAMVGNFGGEDPVPLAAVAFGTSISWLFLFLCIGMSVGLTPVIGELYVQGRNREMAHYLQTSLWLYPMFGLACMVLQIAFEPTLYLLNQPIEVVNDALPYYRLMAYSLPLVMIYGAVKQFLEGVGNTRAAMVVIITTNLINILLNYIFIFGKCGFEPMGVYGAGLATLVSRLLNPILLGGYVLLSKRYREYISLFSRKVEYCRNSLKLLRIGYPIAGQMVLEALAFIVTGIMMGWFNDGGIAISANQVGNTYGNCTFMLILSLGSATTICVSHAFGRRDIKEIYEVVRASLAMAVVWGVCVIIAFVSLRHVMPLLFTQNEEVIALASSMLVLYATYQLSDAIQCIFVGVLRGLQQVKSIAVIAFISYIVLNIPVGYLVAFHFGMGATGLIVGYIVGLSTAAILYGIKAMRYLCYLRKIS
ncbi:MAG: MATE family efflux transporter [Alistipes sp.]|nr:MATE family efflux transporter [Alistipes sp.]